MFRNNRISCRINREIKYFTEFLPQIIFSMIIGAVIIFFSWTKFGGPCRATLLFRIPGGGITIAAYYVLWFIMFLLCGGETAIICHIGKPYGNKLLLFHIASHLCAFLWYPLFFTSFSQLLALLVLTSAGILLVLELKELAAFSLIVSVSILLKIIITAIFIYINIAFLIIN